MASAKKCDACGEFYEFNNDEQKANGITFTYFNESGQASHTVGRMELCPVCMSKVKQIVGKGEVNYA